MLKDYSLLSIACVVVSKQLPFWEAFYPMVITVAPLQRLSSSLSRDSCVGCLYAHETGSYLSQNTEADRSQLCWTNLSEASLLSEA